MLPRDLVLLLSVMDQAINTFQDISDLEIHKFVYKFSQKRRDLLDLECITVMENNQQYSLHVGCTFTPCNTNTTVFWSGAGMQDTADVRAKLQTCMSMHECVNMQNSLWHHGPWPLVPSLENVPSFLRSWPLFNSPHVYCLPTFRRPVTGLVITCGLAHNSAKNKWAIEYYSQMDDMAMESLSKICLSCINQPDHSGLLVLVLLCMLRTRTKPCSALHFSCHRGGWIFRAQAISTKLHRVKLQHYIRQGQMLKFQQSTTPALNRFSIAEGPDPL